MKHCMVTAIANFGGPLGGLRSKGRSAIQSETGDLLVQLESEGSGFGVVTETQQSHLTRAIMQGDS